MKLILFLFPPFLKDDEFAWNDAISLMVFVDAGRGKVIQKENRSYNEQPIQRKILINSIAKQCVNVYLESFTYV